MIIYNAVIDKQTIARWALLVGVGSPLTLLIVCAMLSPPSQGGFPLAMLIGASYLGTLIFTALAHYRPKFIRTSVSFYMIFALGVIVSYRAVNPIFTNSCNCHGQAYSFNIFGSGAPSVPVSNNVNGDVNAIEQCF